jgi:uncharacterized GH25 family protein
MKRIASIFTLICLYILLSSHEFWLQPDKFIYQKGEKANIRFLVGENFEGENWSGNRSRVNSLVFYQNNQQKDLTNALSENKGDSLQLLIEQEGTAMITFNSKNSFIELEAAKFNDYLKEDGLTSAIEYRKTHHETDSMGNEFYQRSVKTIIQAGNKYDDIYKKETTLPLDIIPQENPYQLTDGAEISIKIFFQKKPLTNTLIKIWHRENNKTRQQDMTTDLNGMIRLNVKRSGHWMISAVKMVHLENDPKANWQSYWGSLTWGYDKR